MVERKMCVLPLAIDSVLSLCLCCLSGYLACLSVLSVLCAVCLILSLFTLQKPHNNFLYTATRAVNANDDVIRYLGSRESMSSPLLAKERLALAGMVGAERF